MMRERLKHAAGTPHFKTLLQVGVQHLVSAKRTLDLVGLDVNELIEEALQSCLQQLNDAAYELTNLDELLNHAQAMGDTSAQEEGTPQPREVSGSETKENDYPREGDIGKSN